MGSWCLPHGCPEAGLQRRALVGYECSHDNTSLRLRLCAKVASKSYDETGLEGYRGYGKGRGFQVHSSEKRRVLYETSPSKWQKDHLQMIPILSTGFPMSLRTSTPHQASTAALWQRALVGNSSRSTNM